jgi:hypothetical protein
MSLHSRSRRGVQAMDIFTTIVQTSKKLGVSAYCYFHSRLQRAAQLPLAILIRLRAASV